MCLLNGEIGGNLPASIDFGVEEYVDLDNKVTTYTKIPIKNIIKEALHTYANEPYHNIIIQDLEQMGLELLEYRGEDPIYLLYNTVTNTYSNATIYGTTKCTRLGETESITIEELEDEELFNRVDLIKESATKIKLDGDSDNIYQVAKLEYGQTAGYHITNLTYAGDLISSIGETLTSILDKIKNMLGEFEYFYDLEGRFIFRKKQIYINSVFNNIVNTEDDKYVENSAYNSQISYTFEGGKLVTAYQNTPNLANLKNDFSVWGNRRTVSGIDVPIHYRYAIDHKPIGYCQIKVEEADIPSDLRKQGMKPRLEQKYFSVDEYDWREVIYQMAVDNYKYGRLENFLSKVIEANKNINDDVNGLISLYPTGKTGYEQYYIDILSFWRDLYNPEGEPSVFAYQDTGMIKGEPNFIFNEDKYPQGLFIKNKYKKFKYSLQEWNDTYLPLLELYSEDTLKGQQIREERNKELKKLLDSVLVLQLIQEDNDNSHYELQPLLNSILVDFDFNESGEQNSVNQDGTEKGYKYVITHPTESGYADVVKSIINRIEKKELFIELKEQNPIQLVNYMYNLELKKEEIDRFKNWYIKDSNTDLIKLGDYLNSIDYEPLKVLYQDSENENKYNNYILFTKTDIYGNVIADEKPIKNYIQYFYKDYEYYKIEDIEKDENMDINNLYWNKQIREAPDALNFWFDFLDEGELNQFAVPVVGNRSKVVNDKDVKGIYFRQVPEIMYIRNDDITTDSNESLDDYKAIDISDYYHYTRINNIPDEYFSLSSQGKSAQTTLEELLYNHSYCIETINITAIPVYYLEPNVRILVKDELSKINGEYLVSRISIPLTYNGTMSITATKAPVRLL